MTTRWLPAAVAFVVALVWRYCIVTLWPTAYSFDGFQRWAGREHVLVQDWLPATQVVIWAVAQLGGGIAEGRTAMAVVGAGAACMGALLVQELAAQQLGPRAQIVAGWVWVVASLFGPWGSWGTVFYQESTFLLVLFSGLWLALTGRVGWADLAMGALGLVRYEGWPCVLLYIAWRRQLRAGVALWGMATWLAIRGLGIEGYHASPVNFADWEGLADRFEMSAYLRDLNALGTRVLVSGSIAWMLAGLLGLWALRDRGPIRLVALLFFTQAAATLAWLAGLEVSTSRMLVIPTAIASTLGAVGVAWAEERVRPRWVVPLGLLVMFAVSVNDGGRRAKVESSRVREERVAVTLMGECPGCTWWVLPRRRLGTRDRHDGCEVIQGTTDLLHGHDFYCAPWVPPEDAMALYTRCSGTIRWDGGKYSYVLERHVPGTVGSPPELFEAPRATIHVERREEE